MITLLHGDNIVASRNVLNNLIDEEKRRGNVDIVRLNGEEIELADLKQALESESLFGTDKLVVIENLLSRKRSKTKEELTAYLKGIKSNYNIILWERKSATPANQKKLPTDANIREFKVSPVIFKFLDSLAPQNTKSMLLMMHESISQESTEMVFYLLCRRMSSLIIAADIGTNGLNRLQNWQKSRLVRQAKRFTLDDLLNIHEKLYDIDKEIKTGRNILPLASMLDLTVAEI